jgi:aquaporin Z
MATTMTSALRKHWPEYLIEGWALGTFMVSAGLVATLLGAPASPVHRVLPDPMWRNAAGGIAMGLTAIALIHSGWGKPPLAAWPRRYPPCTGATCGSI